MKRFLSKRTERPPDEDSTGRDILNWALRRAVARIADKTADISVPENVHQARVGLRRFRSTLHTFRGLFDPAWTDGLREAVRPLADQLGHARDADVLYARLSGHEVVASALAANRDRARADLAAALAAPGFAATVARLEAAAAEPKLAPAADDPAARCLMPYVAPVWHRLQHKARSLDEDSAPDELHRVRILTKHARYAAETLTPVVGEAERFAERAAGVQEVLGEVQDASFARAWLEETARSSGDAFECGTLAGLELAAAARETSRWTEVWERLDRKKVTRWISDAWTPPDDEPAVYLVRHAKAGDRATWTRADEIRPLTRAGLRQAQALVRLLKKAGVTRVASSPYTRCMQTVEPLAAAASLPVVPEAALAEGAALDASLALLATTEPIVLCTHGDVMENVIGYLARRGVAGADPSMGAKGSTWVLRLKAQRADYLPPQA